MKKMKQIFEFPALVESITNNLFLNIEKYPDLEIFNKFFVQRQNEADDLHAKLGEVNEYGGNVLVVGEPGIGKTIFLKWFLDESQFAKQGVLTYDLLDLRRQPGGEDTSIDFLRRFRDRLADIVVPQLRLRGDPCNDIPDRDSDNLARFNYCADKLQKATVRSSKRDAAHCVFVDDVDYIDERSFCMLLDQLRPVLLSPLFSVIIACRTPAYNTVQSHHDYNIANAFEDARTLWLQPLPVRTILEARLEMLQSSKSLRRLEQHFVVRKLANIAAAIRKIVSSLSDGDDIQGLMYPFSPKQHNFMRAMSNGNIRQVLQMAQQLLKYMAAHKNDITRDETGYRIGRESAIELFTSSVPDKIRIINLHAIKTYQYLTKDELKANNISADKVGNSVYVVILEVFKQFGETGNLSGLHCQQALEAYGLSETQIARAIAELRENHLIRERTLPAHAAIGSQEPERIYELTDRGEYYITYLVYWPEYVRRFGTSSHQVGLRDKDALGKLEASVLEFLVNIACVLDRKIPNRGLDFKISRLEFLRAFSEEYGALILQISRINEDVRALTVTHMTSLLAGYLDVIREHKMEGSKNYYFLGARLIEQCKKRNVSLEEKHIYKISDFETFVSTYVRLPDGD
jgi:AAA ATPase domain